VWPSQKFEAALTVQDAGKYPFLQLQELTEVVTTEIGARQLSLEIERIGIKVAMQPAPVMYFVKRNFEAREGVSGALSSGFNDK